MFVILLHYENGLDAVEAALPAHVCYLERHYADGSFLLSGRREPRTGGVIFCRAGSRAEVEVLVAEDPFARAGAARHEIIEFYPNLWAPGMKELLVQKVL